jgi:hypothetical protein
MHHVYLICFFKKKQRLPSISVLDELQFKGHLYEDGEPRSPNRRGDKHGELAVDHTTTKKSPIPNPAHPIYFASSS